MALSDSDVQRQIKHMMAFIEQEANEKAEEVDAKAEEEFNIEKGRLVTEQRLKIIDYYTRKEKHVELQRKIQSSNMLGLARLKVLKAGEDHIAAVIEEARRKLGDITKDPARYKALLHSMVLQGLLQLLELEATVICRPQDAGLLELEPLAEQYQELTGREVALSLEASLPADSFGGIQLLSKRGRIRVCNTLESRLDMIALHLLPQIRTSLFGRNPNRKFMD